MTQQTINIGVVANDGTGDPARTAFTKVNDNCSELYNNRNLTNSVASVAASDILSLDQGTGNKQATVTQLAAQIAIINPSTPGGATNSLQYNTGSAFGGSSFLTYDGTNTITFGTGGAGNAQYTITSGVPVSSTGTRLRLKGGNSSTGAGGALELAGGTSTSTTGSGVGGAVSITGGIGSTLTTAGHGGSISLVSGTGFGSTNISNGGSITVTAGNGSSTSGTGGTMTFTAGTARGGSNAGNIVFNPGDVATSSGAAGSFLVYAGDNAGTGRGGDVNLYAGASSGSSLPAGVLELAAGTANGDAPGGTATVRGGDTLGSGTAGNLNLYAGIGVTPALSGSVIIYDAASNATTIFSPYGTVKLGPILDLASLISLCSAATAGVGARAFVTDALSPVFGSTVVGGGAVNVPVYSDGTNWKVG